MLRISAFAIYHGAEVRTHKRDTSTFPEWRKIVSRGYGMDRVRTYTGAPAFAKSVIAALMGADFDVTACGDVPEPEKLGDLGHAYGFVCERLFGGSPPRLVPVLVNTFTSLNRPSPRRCIAFGRALRKAIESYPEDLRVAVIASGGLSHFLCEEELDRKILAALAEDDTDALAALPEPALSSGSSEIRSWIVLSGLLHGYRMQWNEYVPVHRTPPGSGIGMGWAVWSSFRPIVSPSSRSDRGTAFRLS